MCIMAANVYWSAGNTRPGILTYVFVRKTRDQIYKVLSKCVKCDTDSAFVAVSYSDWSVYGAHVTV